MAYQKVECDSRLLDDNAKAERTQAWLDGLCDKHAAERVGLVRQSYTCWRGREPDMPPNGKTCPLCQANRTSKHKLMIERMEKPVAPRTRRPADGMEKFARFVSMCKNRHVFKNGGTDK